MKKILLYSLLFISSMAMGQNKIISGEYWFDTNPDSKSAMSFSPASEITYSGNVDISALYDGLHSLHIRFVDDSARWSSVKSSFFLKFTNSSGATTNNITALEYWFDNEHNKALIENITETKEFVMSKSLDISSLSNGLHTFHARFKDSMGNWSPAVSRFFIVISSNQTSQNAELTELEYWFDNENDKSVVKPIAGTKEYIMSESLDVSPFSKGLHTFHVRFKDTYGHWSSVVSRFFIIPPDYQSGSGKELTEIEYWFDNQIGSRTTVSLTSATEINFLDNFDISTLIEGLHTVHIRFKDNSEMYSSAVSKFFLVLPQNEEITENKIVNYRYWINDGEIQTGNIAVPSSEISLIDSIDMRLNPKGEYSVHFQFEDEKGNWSSTVSKVINKLSYPYAIIDNSKDEICAGDEVLLTAKLVDTDSLVWKINNIDVTGTDSLKQNLNSPGLNNVSLMALDTVNKINRIYILDGGVTVNALPDIEMGENIEICEGQTAIIEGPVGMTSYDWSNGGSSSSVILNAEGRYYLLIKDENACENTDSIDLLVRALPVIDLGEDISLVNDENHTFDAGEGNSTYLWNGTTGNRYFTATGTELGSGDYELVALVENAYGCSASDTVIISVEIIDHLNTLSSMQLKLYPNPVQEYLHLEWNGNDLMKKLEISIIDLSGKIWINQILNGSDEEIDVKNLSVGSYFLRLKIGQEVRTVQFVKR
jgi:Secretion system C-terminal sorting domain